jgi:dihydrofolate reductase
MRKIEANFFMSLDGVVEAPEKWHFPYFNEEMGAVVGAGLGTNDAVLMGRVLYDEWASYWPAHDGEDNDFAAWINGVDKYVVSTTLEQADWANTTIIGDEVAAQITELKERPGGNIMMSGSATLVRSLITDGLLDELHLLVHPIVVGNGQRLFEEGAPELPLKLASSETFSTGVLNLTYEPA